MTDRKRSPLPKGYQFGDAGKGPTVAEVLEDQKTWRPQHENAAEQLKKRAEALDIHAGEE